MRKIIFILVACLMSACYQYPNYTMFDQGHKVKKEKKRKKFKKHKKSKNNGTVKVSVK